MQLAGGREVNGMVLTRRELKETVGGYKSQVYSIISIDLWERSGTFSAVPWLLVNSCAY